MTKEQRAAFNRMLDNYLRETGQAKALDQIETWAETDEYVDGPMMVKLFDSI